LDQFRIGGGEAVEWERRIKPGALYIPSMVLGVGGFQDAITFGFAEGKVGQSGFEGAVVIFLDRGHGCVVQREQAVEAGGEAGDDIGRITCVGAGFLDTS
jgi:hypothetical protein